MVARSHGKHFILCVGPYFSVYNRVDAFCSFFGKQKYFSCINAYRFSRTQRTGRFFTCMTRCFIYDGSSLDFGHITPSSEYKKEIFNEYDWAFQVQNKLISEEKAKIANNLDNILLEDEILYIDAEIDGLIADFLIIRPNKGVVVVKLVEDDVKDIVFNDLKKSDYVYDRSQNLLCNVAYQSRASLDVKSKLCVTESETLSSVLELERDNESIDYISNCNYNSPFEYVKEFRKRIYDNIDKLFVSSICNKKLFKVFKEVVIFLNNSYSEVSNYLYANHVDTNYIFVYGYEFADDLNIARNLYHELFYNVEDYYFDDVTKRKLIQLISPSWHRFKEGRIDLNPKGPQKILAESTPSLQKICGVAGSGKTQVLVFRAINSLKRTGGRVLILTFNITLVNYIRLRLSEVREDFLWNMIDIYHYHEFFKVQAAKYKLKVSLKSFEDIGFFNRIENIVKYSAIFIDEVQDFKSEWIQIIKDNFLCDRGEFVVFGDSKQNMYCRELDKNGDIKLGLIPGQWNRKLTKSRRFTNPSLANLATDFQNEFMKEFVTDCIELEDSKNFILGFSAINYFDMGLYLNNQCLDYKVGCVVNIIIDIISKNDYRYGDFVVLVFSRFLVRMIDYNFRMITNQCTETTDVSHEDFNSLNMVYRNAHDVQWGLSSNLNSLRFIRRKLFSTDNKSLKISTINSFKGWESPSVIFILDEKLTLENKEFVYTAITRARERLYIINIGNDVYSDFFASHSAS